MGVGGGAHYKLRTRKSAKNTINDIVMVDNNAMGNVKTRKMQMHEMFYALYKKPEEKKIERQKGDTV